MATAAGDLSGAREAGADQSGRGSGSPAPSASGHRLVQAFQALERFPALAHSRDRLIDLVSSARPDARELVSVVESDPALTLAVLACAKRAGASDAIAASVPRALEALPLYELGRIASGVQTVEFLESPAAMAHDAEAFRMHALATRDAADRIRKETNRGKRDEIVAAALLHDIGKVVLLAAYDRYREMAFVRAVPEERLELERDELGIDHAMAGGVLARRLGLPSQITAAIQGHHGDDVSPEVATIRLADMLAHYQGGQPVDADATRRAAAVLGLSDEELHAMLYTRSAPSESGARDFDPSPLSRRQHDVLKLLARGKPYKEIAMELGLSQSTVRSHLQAIYEKLDVIDRAQAVLLANERGWL